MQLDAYQENLEKLVAMRTHDLAAINAQLEAANKELEAFSYSVSHDLRTPLRAIDGYANILLEDYADKLDPEGKRIAGIIRDGAQKMGNLINDILAFSRVGRQELVGTNINMCELVDQALVELKPALEGRSITLDVRPLPPADGDAAMLRCVWINLLDNAIKFTKSRASATIEVGAKLEAAETAYYVKDNGIGFDMKYVSKLFGVFQRLQSQGDYPGTGIGLAIVKRIIVRHQGRVWAQGALNEGACFSFTLPRKDKNHA